MVISDAPMVVAALEDMKFVMDLKIARMVQMKEWIVSFLYCIIKLVSIPEVFVL